MRGSSMRNVGWIVAAGLLGAALIAPSAVLGAKPAPAHQIAICHATVSDTNPYVLEKVDVSSSGVIGGGHNSHLGPIWDPTLKKTHTRWGDIIPPYTYGAASFAGLNWTADGQARFAADCAAPKPAPSDSAGPSAPASPSTPPSEAPSTAPSDNPAPSDASSPAPVTSDAPSSSASSGPVGQVEGATGAPDLTPPPTDAVARLGQLFSSGNNGLLLILAILCMVGAGVCFTQPLRNRR